ncbi:hypothetical protein [Pedobacter alluvionis]|uniref:Uncharacterized protein n=1 Tax=Pedobacter alluvionis TaxID=475253 RepID=A0A497YCA8_9SPHI|nr:hypothetical protein [Pedobacter alluvionis]RLJ80845.1 hypothetical protein BCL90_1647 [Pedobacter alluvionis]TFB32081.1 hypothetical protein E3V97_16120 [Pedobacter alluvionis]
MRLIFTAGLFALMILLMTGCKPNSVDRINTGASITSISRLPENPLEMIPMAVSLQPQRKTMSTLYGNGIAAKRLKDDADYAAGSVLYLVTWKGKADPDWFGARIPDRVMAIESVYFDQNGQKSYTFFKGPAWNSGLDLKKEERLSIILSIPVAKSP